MPTPVATAARTATPVMRVAAPRARRRRAVIARVVESRSSDGLGAGVRAGGQVVLADVDGRDGDLLVRDGQVLHRVVAGGVLTGEALAQVGLEVDGLLLVGLEGEGLPRARGVELEQA